MLKHKTIKNKYALPWLKIWAFLLVLTSGLSLTIELKAQSTSYYGFNLSGGISHFSDQAEQSNFSPIGSYSFGFTILNRLSPATTILSDLSLIRRGAQIKPTNQKIRNDYFEFSIGPLIKFLSDRSKIGLGAYAGLLPKNTVQVQVSPSSEYEFKEIDGGIWVGLFQKIFISGTLLILDYYNYMLSN